MVKNDFKPAEFEPKWAKEWVERKTYRAEDISDKPKSYLLIEFPYPSGERLHVGHARSYSCLDAVARLRRMKGYNVLYPLGWDAFGLPAENYAIKTGIHPSITTAQNITNAKEQAIRWGLSFDWTREINTTDPEYYKWTQWIFLKLFKAGLAYKKEIAVNWCPSCKINLADEEVIEGKCERCGTVVERRKQSQWLLRITQYADRLLKDLETVNYRDDIKQQQINWIGKKEGARVKFEIGNETFNVSAEVFTTRIDTIFGATFLVVAPEVAATWLENGWQADNEVKFYIEKAINTNEEERKKTEKQKTGVNTKLVATNPANGEKIPVYVADYVLKGVGTGVVMGVPAHDKRDLEFAKKHNLPILPVLEIKGDEEVYEGEGNLINSGNYNGLNSEKVREQMFLEGLGEKMVHYHLRDWIFSRQHYWGEPIPMIFCDKCANLGHCYQSNNTSDSENGPKLDHWNEEVKQNTAGWWPVDETELPVKLPEVEKYQPTDTGESPLSKIDSWVKVKCPNCGGEARRETDTMPNWAGSSWYYLRYIDPQNNIMLASSEKLKYWLPVDWYNGGMEHTTLHLLYSRFWHKVLFDLKVVPTAEPYAKRTSHGVVRGPDGRKMSKSKGNVINPADVIDKYGADTLRMYEMFIGPFSQMVTWSWESVEGVYRFLRKIWMLSSSTQYLTPNPSPESGEGNVSSKIAKAKMATLVNKVESDIEEMKYNTAVAAMMEFSNWWAEHTEEMGKDMVDVFLLALAPMAPFVTEEIYQQSHQSDANFESIHLQKWPELQVEEQSGSKVVIVQVDGKVRGKVELPADTDEKTAEEAAKNIENVAKYIGERSYKFLFVPGKIVNFILQ